MSTLRRREDGQIEVVTRDGNLVSVLELTEETLDAMRHSLRSEIEQTYDGVAIAP